jgi:hypothetical protein
MPNLIHRVPGAVARSYADLAAERVHFHAGDHGRPYVCEDPRCSSPSLNRVS